MSSAAVLDTHVWVTFGLDPSKLSRSIRTRLDRVDLWMIPAISVWEYWMLVARGYIEIRNPKEWLGDFLSLSRVRRVDLTPEIVRVSVELDWRHRDPADRMIVATALTERCPVLTQDRRILAFFARR